MFVDPFAPRIYLFWIYCHVCFFRTLKRNFDLWKDIFDNTLQVPKVSARFIEKKKSEQEYILSFFLKLGKTKGFNTLSDKFANWRVTELFFSFFKNSLKFSSEECIFNAFFFEKISKKIFFLRFIPLQQKRLKQLFA